MNQPGQMAGYFDSAERDRIRRIMLRYMQDNRIGTPKLRDLIAAANGLALRRDGKDPIALSTVQRFVAGTHRANDTFVGLCARFVADLPDVTPIATFGDQLATFVALGDPHGLTAVPSDLFGLYDCKAQLEISKGPLRLRLKGDESDFVPYSELRIGALRGRPFAAIREAIIHKNASAVPDPFPTTRPRHSYEGILMYPAGAAFALMRNILTGTPRTYWLGRNADGRLFGEGHEAPSHLKPPDQSNPAVAKTTRIMLTPLPEIESDDG